MDTDMPKPYYSDESATIYHGDCLEIMPSLGPVDMILTDPPYFRVKNEPWDRAWSSGAEFLRWLASVADLWVERLAQNGSLYCFASPEMGARVEVMLSERLHVLNRIRWVKRNGWHRKAERETLRRYLTPWEEIIFCERWGSDDDAAAEAGYEEATDELHKRVYAPIGKYIQGEREKSGLTRNQVEVALGYVSTADPTRGTALCCRWEEGSSLPTAEAYRRLRGLLNHDGRALLLRKEYEELRKEYEELRKEYEELRRPFNVEASEDAYDVWHFETVPVKGCKHPCEKPLALLEYAICKSSKEGALVLDSFAGTGSTLDAARRCGRRAIGIEQSERYCELAAKRLQQALLF